MTKTAAVLAGALVVAGCGLDRLGEVDRSTRTPDTFPDVAAMYEITSLGVTCSGTVDPPYVAPDEVICSWVNVTYDGQPECYLTLIFEPYGATWGISGSTEMRGPSCP